MRPVQVIENTEQKRQIQLLHLKKWDEKSFNLAYFNTVFYKAYRSNIQHIDYSPTKHPRKVIGQLE